MVVDGLRRIGPPGALAEEDELVEFGAAHSVVVFEVLTPHRVVDLYAALLAGFNLVDEIQVSGENRRPSKIFHVAHTQAHRAGDDAEQRPAILLIAFKVFDESVIVGAFERLGGCRYSFCCHIMIFRVYKCRRLNNSWF